MTKYKEFANFHRTNTKNNIIALFLRVIQSLVAAISAIVIVHSFNKLINQMQTIEADLFPFLPLWTVAGALLVVLVIYKISPGSKTEAGIEYIHIVNKDDERFTLKSTIFKYWAALFTLGTFGNGGIVGPVGRVTAGLNCVVEEKFGSIQKFDPKVGAISGFAAAIGVIFHAPIAGGVFAVEILDRSNMRYHHLFPALLSSAFAVYFTKILNLPAFYVFNIPAKEIPTNIYLLVIIIGFVTGIVGRVFNILYQTITKFTKRNKKKHLLREVVFISIVVGLATYFINPDLMGTSNHLIYQLTNDLSGIHGNLPNSMNIFFVLLLYLVIKMVANCLTVGSGLSAGFTGPIIIIGMIIGVIFSTIAGIEYYSPEYYALICAGFTGMLASSMNIPIAAMVLSIELFGYNYAITGIITTIIAFKINDYNTLFDYDD